MRYSPTQAMSNIDKKLTFTDFLWENLKIKFIFE
jgi:hypothetical protein